MVSRSKAQPNIASLAMIEAAELSEEQVTGLLDHFATLLRVNTANVPAFQYETKHRLREDIPRPGLTQDEALANAPCVVNGMFRVPAILDDTHLKGN